MRLLLASASPRRADLLTAAGFEYDIAPAGIDEAPRQDESPASYVMRMAHTKADTVGRRSPDRIVLGADTVVVIDNRILGKPSGPDEAAEMLRMLSGRVHEVLTGVALLAPERRASDMAATKVRFRPLSDAELGWYVETGEPYGKAGGYAIQGRASRFIECIDGSYSNVVGLPIATVYQLLQAIDPERKRAIS